MKLVEINQKLKNMKAENLPPLFPEVELKEDPFEQFLVYFQQALASSHSDPSAMILATVDAKGYPDTRMVLLKELEDQRFIFYTHYGSKKAKDLAHQPVAALNFYWPELFYQIRIRGRVEKLSREKNEAYFSSRARGSQLSAQAWVQSSILSSEEELDERIRQQETEYAEKPIPCPENWGGYALCPFEYEFFQRRQWRRHERIRYTLEGKSWKKVRLAP